MKMPRLSISLQGPRHPNICQSCEAQGVQDDVNAKNFLTVWRECDTADRPDRCVVILCKKCSKKLVGPHPRLYIELPLHQPRPGSMPVCADCPFRHKLRCTHPDLSGGIGPLLRFPEPFRVHVLYSRKVNGVRGEWLTMYSAPVECAGREQPLPEEQPAKKS